MIKRPRDKKVAAGTGAAFLVLLTVVIIAQPLAAQPPGTSSVLVDKVVAVVAGKFQSGVPAKIVTRWDLEAECRLESIQRYGQSGVDRPISKSMRATVLERIIDDSIIYREAMRLDGADVGESEIEEAFSVLAESVGVEDFGGLLEDADLPVTKVKQILERRTIADMYVVDNLALTLSLGEMEMQKAFEKMDHPYSGQEYSEVREQFREWYIGILSGTHRDKLIVELETRCRVWIFFSPGAADS
jgi:hypothetical protein